VGGLFTTHTHQDSQLELNFYPPLKSSLTSLFYPGSILPMPRPNPCTVTFDTKSHTATFYDQSGDLLFKLRQTTWGHAQIMLERINAVQGHAYRTGVEAVQAALTLLTSDEVLSK